MSLTDRELEQMRKIERRLAADDPSFARRMTGWAWPVGPFGLPVTHRSRPTHALGWLLAGIAAYMVFSALLLLTVGGAMNATTFGVALAVGFLGLWCVVVAVHQARRMTGDRPLLRPVRLIDRVRARRRRP